MKKRSEALSTLFTIRRQLMATGYIPSIPDRTGNKHFALCAGPDTIHALQCEPEYDCFIGMFDGYMHTCSGYAFYKDILPYCSEGVIAGVLLIWDKEIEGTNEYQLYGNRLLDLRRLTGK